MMTPLLQRYYEKTFDIAMMNQDDILRHSLDICLHPSVYDNSIHLRSQEYMDISDMTRVI